MYSATAKICLCAAATAAYISSNGAGVSAFSIETSRRVMLEKVTGAGAAALIGISSAATIAPSPAQASGGATAGGAYLLSAKQRYNSRVTAGVKGFLALSGPLEGGSIAEAKAFLSSEGEGGWGDFKSAGYLLSNAFRRSSSTAPDSLPSVKAWKAFAAEVEKMQKAADKKSKSGVGDAYKKAEVLLDSYLELVELPPSIEISRS
eukprot:CAMPEP_0181052442 /NCGR_PEP_ID=MMETSP1070-20121207/17593_1 /TAXON_ID=265543 /ORGANISM="Minutocellus polymorphus, Strain NH13" /LENGTH=204 /DNA_ID=CAMNT_0023131537 /DNA_START=40 /DNA_END=654 /DNA_ORIENTATION=+